MTVREAAEFIGVHPNHIRALIREGKLRAIRKPIPNGYYYEIRSEDVVLYKNTPQGKGWERGRSRRVVF